MDNRIYFFAQKTQYFLLTLFILVQQPIAFLPSVKVQLALICTCDIIMDLTVTEIRHKKAPNKSLP